MHIVVVILQLEIIVETTFAHAAHILLRLIALFAHVTPQSAKDLVATSTRLAHEGSTRRIRRFAFRFRYGCGGSRWCACGCGGSISTAAGISRGNGNFIIGFFGLQIHHERIQNPSANPPIKIYLHDEEVRLRLDIMCVALAEVAIAVAMARVAFLLARRFELPRTAVILGTTIESATNGPIFQMRIGDREFWDWDTEKLTPKPKTNERTNCVC